MRYKSSKLNICRIVAMFLAVLMAAFVMPLIYSSAAESGNSGNLKWHYADGTLTISGNGAMANYTETSRAPWDELAANIRVVNIERGVTSVGSFAFKGCYAITSVNISDSVSSIGNFAFMDCTALKMLSVGSSLRTIGESAFESCTALQSVRIPNGTITIGRKAFYRCDALRSITVPQSVTSMGSMVFARCNGLVSADIRASVSTLPLWTFYGCDALADVTLGPSINAIDRKAFYNCNNLKNVYYLGPASRGSDIEAAIRENISETAEFTMQYTSSSAGQSQSTVIYNKDEKTTVVETVTVKDSGNASISTTITAEAVNDPAQGIIMSDPTVKVDAVIENKTGWNELADAVKEVENSAVDSSSKVQVSVNYNSDDSIKGDALSDLSGKDVNVTVNMNDGSTVKIDCSRLDGANVSGNYQMSYSLTANNAPETSHTEVLGDSQSYLLSFSGDTEFDFSPKIYVGSDSAHSCATLYQTVDGELNKVQSAIVDKEGNATFYLQSAYKSTEYVVAIDVVGVDRAEAIIPDELMEDYGITDSFEQIIEYVPTVERKFLGMNIAQFSFFIFGSIAALVVVFGVVMGVFYRKKRLEMFYRMKMEEEGREA